MPKNIVSKWRANFLRSIAVEYINRDYEIKITEIVKQMANELDFEEKVMYLFQYMLENIMYDYEKENEQDLEDSINPLSYQYILQTNKGTNYARAKMFQDLCKEAGIDCYLYNTKVTKDIKNDRYSIKRKRIENEFKILEESEDLDEKSKLEKELEGLKQVPHYLPVVGEANGWKKSYVDVNCARLIKDHKEMPEMDIGMANPRQRNPYDFFMIKKESYNKLRTHVFEEGWKQTTTEDENGCNYAVDSYSAIQSSMEYKQDRKEQEEKKKNKEQEK